MCGPGYYNWDISLQKNFQRTERFKLQFRTDFLNAFNAVNLAVPNTTVNVSTTGVIKHPVCVEALLLTTGST